MKASKEQKPGEEAAAHAEPAADAESEPESTATTAQDLEDELLTNPPKGSVDKLRVLRARMKRLNGKIKENPQVCCLLEAFSLSHEDRAS